MAGPSLTTIIPSTDTENATHKFTCERTYKDPSNETILQTPNKYEGIPQNLLLNVIAWLVLLLVFTFLRKVAWNYGRIALVSRTETRMRTRQPPITANTESRYNVWTTLFYGGDAASQGSQESLDTQVTNQDKGFFSWIVAYFKIKDEHILKKTGPDGVQYLKFQRYLIVYMCIIMVLSIAVILPVNFQGNLEGDESSFGHTTIANINVSTNPNLLWVHTVFSVLYLVVAIAFMRHFSLNLGFQEDEQATRTLMISNIPKEYCFKNHILQHFREAYPEKPVQDVQFAYNVNKLSKLDKDRQFAMDARLNSELIYQKTGEKPEMVPVVCGQCCCRCCQSKMVDCIEYYKEQEEKLYDLCEEEKVEAFRNALGIAFITFESDEDSRSVNLDFKMTCHAGVHPRTSTVASMLNVHSWEVKYAPAPNDLYWENLALSPALWWFKAVIFNILLFLLLFFLTTPSVVLGLLDSYGPLNQLHSPFLVQIVPVLLLFAVSALLPNLVYIVDYYCIGHWTRSREHYEIMRKTFILLLLMILLLPSLGLTSASAMLRWIGQRDEEQYKFQWQCVFVPGNGAFFVNYVITAAFIGTALELMRAPDLLIYALKLSLAKSEAERKIVTKRCVFEFQYGAQYAWMLCVFSVIMAFSILCPMITPFGVIYLLFKHMVARYNLYFAYTGSKITKKIHTGAINFVIAALVLQQGFLVAFTWVRSGTSDSTANPLLIFQLICLVVTLCVLSGRVCCGVFKCLSPVIYKPGRETDEAEVEVTGGETSGTEKPFVPNVLTQTSTEPIVLEDSQEPQAAQASDRSYGATDTTNTVDNSTSDQQLLQNKEE